MIAFIVVLIIVGGLAYFWAGENDLEGESGCLFALIIGLFWAILAFFVMM